MLLFLFVIDCAGIDNPIQFCYFVTVHPLPEPLPPGAGNTHCSLPRFYEDKCTPPPVPLTEGEKGGGGRGEV